jgi:tetratricopeptide (TPR) repeat protein
MTYAQIAAAYPVLKIAPFDKAGFNAVALPFKFISKDNAGDPAEALAFSFLMSHSLDWSPGCRCTRHAYFVFKRSSAVMQSLAKGYDDNLICKTIEGWAATHAVGGTITAGKDGYSGELVIYDTTSVVHTKKFAAARDYFTLLGDMTVEAMTFLDEKPNEELSKFLHARRCQPQSIIDLGKAAFLPERGEEEFGLYADILKRDPSFADVRYWWSNQKQWVDDDRDLYHRQIAIAMDAYPVTGVFELQNEQKKYPHFAAWLDQVRKLIGKDSPLAIRLELAGERADEINAGKPDGGKFGPLLDRLKEVVGKSPNDYWLAFETADAMSQDMRFADSDAAAAMFAIAGMSNYMTAFVNHHDAAVGLMCVLTDGCGRSDWSAALALKHADHWLKEGDKKYEAHCLARAGEALMQLGCYEEAAEDLERATPSLQPSGMRNCSVLYTGVALALSGHRDRLDIFIQKNSQFGQANGMLPVWKGYLDLLDGKKVTVASVLAGPPPPTWELYVVRDQLCSQVYYLQGDSKGRDQLTSVLRSEPENRLSWALFDAFDRRWPDPKSAAFYDSLEWLHGGDPWVRQAVADFRKRTPKGQYKTADELLASLHAYEPVRWPEMVRNDANRKRDFYVLNAAPVGAFAAAIHTLLLAKDYARANELALRFHHLVSDGPQAIYTPMYANHLVYLVEAASPKPSGGK